MADHLKGFSMKKPEKKNNVKLLILHKEMGFLFSGTLRNLQYLEKYSMRNVNSNSWLKEGKLIQTEKSTKTNAKLVHVYEKNEQKKCNI
jgi:hypothetical protein